MKVQLHIRTSKPCILPLESKNAIKSPVSSDATHVGRVWRVESTRLELETHWDNYQSNETGNWVVSQHWGLS